MSPPSSREQLEYERGWGQCRRCRCRRPLSELEAEAGACRDRAWCDRVVLWREEQREVTELLRRKSRRPRRR